MEEVAETQKAPTSEVVQELSFFAWVGSTFEKARKFVSAGSLLAAAGAIISLRPADLLQKSASDLEIYLGSLNPQRAVLFFIQAATCVLLAVLTPRPGLARLRHTPGLTDERKILAEKACRRIQLNLMFVFFLWCAYYMVSGLGLIIGQGPSSFDNAIALSLSAITALVIFWMYLELSELTVEPIPRVEFSSNSDPGITQPYAEKSDAATNQALSLGVLLLLLISVWYAYGKPASDITTVADIAISCLSGVALCLVVGRFSSKYISPGSFTLACLYFYAVIQPSAPLFKKSAIIYLLATSIALPLKILLWLVCVWALTTGILAEYMYETRVVIERVDRRRALGRAA